MMTFQYVQLQKQMLPASSEVMLNFPARVKLRFPE